MSKKDRIINKNDNKAKNLLISFILKRFNRIDFLIFGAKKIFNL